MKHMLQDLSQTKILVCDDSGHLRSLICMLLRSFGAGDVMDAPGAQQAYDIIVKHGPDLLITDWMMEPVDGMQLVRHVRRSDEIPDPAMPIIMMTSYAELQRVKQARDNGVTVFLAKPLSSQALYEKVCTALEDDRPFVRAAAYCGPDRRAVESPAFADSDRRMAMAV